MASSATENSASRKEDAVTKWWQASEHGITDDMLDVIDTVGVDLVREPSKRTALHMAAARVCASHASRRTHVCSVE